MPYVEIENLSVALSTNSGPRTVVDSVSFTVDKGEIFGIVGESGSGKTMTCSTLLGLTPLHSHVKAQRLSVGEFDLMKTKWSAVRGCEIAMIFQDPAAALNPVFTIEQQIDAVIKQHHKLSRKDRKSRVLELLANVGLPDPGRTARSYPHQLSGGMQQRALIAMAISAGANLLIADEPTTALDVTIQAQILALLKSLRDQFNLTILFVSHDLAVVSQLCDRMAVMLNGQIIETGPVASVLNQPTHEYTKALLAAAPKKGSRGSELPTVAARLQGAPDA